MDPESDGAVSPSGARGADQLPCPTPADETTRFVCARDDQQQQPTATSDMPTQPVPSRSSCTQDPSGPSDGDADVEFPGGMTGDDNAAAASHVLGGRHEAVVEGHRPVLAPHEVPKGFIAVRDQLYKKIEVKGKGGGGKVYKVCLKDDESSIWAIKKIKLGKAWAQHVCLARRPPLALTHGALAGRRRRRPACVRAQ